jgi:hypothetical protein
LPKGQIDLFQLLSHSQKKNGVPDDFEYLAVMIGCGIKAGISGEHAWIYMPERDVVQVACVDEDMI